MSRKNLFLQLWAKTFFHNQILALFFYQYHLKQLINILEVTLNGRKYLRLVTLLVGCGQLCLSVSQIEGLFDHQYICKKSITTTDFLHGDNHQQKEGSEFGFCQLYLQCNQIGGFFDHQYLSEEWIDTVDFLNGETNIKERKDLRVPLMVWCC